MPQATFSCLTEGAGRGQGAGSREEAGRGRPGYLPSPVSWGVWLLQFSHWSRSPTRPGGQKQTKPLLTQLFQNFTQVHYYMSVPSSNTEPVSRKMREGVNIVAGNQDILLNSKEEFLQGAVQPKH